MAVISLTTMCQMQLGENQVLQTDLSRQNWLLFFFYIRRELKSKDAFEFLLVRTVKNASVQNHAATSNACQGHNDSVHNVTSRSIYQQTWYRWAYWAERKDLWLLTSLRMIHRPKKSWKIMVLLWRASVLQRKTVITACLSFCFSFQGCHWEINKVRT